jgi:hypothetical protein
MSSHRTYEEAHKAAVELARLLKRETGILKTKEYNRTVFNVYHLPKPENRYGFELRCEIVRPTDPHLSRNI